MQRRRAATIVILAFIGAWASLAGAQNGSVRDLTQIIASKKVVVAMVAREFPPFIVPDQNGRLAGLEVELATDIADKLGVTLEIVPTVHFDDVIDMVAAGRADIGLSNLSMTFERAKKIKFTDPYRKLDIILLLNRTKLAADKLAAGMQHLDELKNTTDTVGVIGRSAYEAAALKFFPRAKVETYERYEDLIQAAAKGELLLAAGNSGTIDAYLEKNPHLLVTLQPFKIEGRQDHIAMAVGVECSHLLSWLNTYLTVRGMNRN